MQKCVSVATTDEVPQREQVEYWNNLISDTFTTLQSSPVSDTYFSGKLKKAPLGKLSIAEVMSKPCTISHTQSMIAEETAPFFLIHLQLRGSSVNRQDGRQALLEAGDYTLCDSTRPYDLSFNDSNDMLVLRIPQKVLKNVIRAPEDLTCIAMPGNRGMSSLNSSLLTRTWRSYENDWGDEQLTRVNDLILDTLSLSYDEISSNTSATESSVQNVLRMRIKRFIENNLSDPELTPTLIANALEVSTRYLHIVFEAEGISVSRYIMQRRLGEAHKRLSDPAKKSYTVSDIAFNLGFNSLSHFGRAFKGRYGVAPRNLR